MDPVAEVGWVEWFGEVIVGALTEGFALHLPAVLDADDEDGRGRQLLPDGADEGLAVELRHVEVAHDEVGLEAVSDHFEGLDGVGERDGGVFFGKKKSVKTAHDRAVVDDEDMRFVHFFRCVACCKFFPVKV